MQLEYIQLSNEWTDINDIATIEDDVTYFIQNRGADMLVALEANDVPDKDMAGVTVLPHIQAIYKKGVQTLYLRAFNKSCTIDITKAE